MSDRCRLAARISKKYRTVNLHKAGHRQRTDHGQYRHSHHGCRTHSPIAYHCPKQSQINKQFADKAVQRRQAADRDRPDGKHGGCPGHGFGQSAQRIDIPRMHGMHNRACT